jgi:TatD DNase family protein
MDGAPAAPVGEWFDSHCHLQERYLAAADGVDGVADVLARTAAAGVGRMVCVGTDPTTSTQALALVRAVADGELGRDVPQLWATVGLHPHEAVAGTDETIALVERAVAAADGVLVAVGECGLDYHYDHSPRETQRDVFARLIGLARELGKPIVVHTREAAKDTLDILDREGARDVGGIIHCFSEDRPFAARALDLGFDVSISGIVTFKNATGVHDVAAWAPIDRILVETDSPYLAPVPLRGKKCEPAYVVHTARRVAELRGIPLEELAQATLANTERRFRRAFGELAAQADRPHCV